MTQYAVIADDLTGAGDTGVQFAKAGTAARILLGTWSKSDIAGCEVVVTHTESRALAPKQAYAAVANCAAMLAEAGVVPLYKKVDSTLRGQIGAEIDAMMDVWHLPMALLCPAFPANGRTLLGGYLLVQGQPVSRTPIGVDPVCPVKESHIPTLLRGQTTRPVHSISCSDLDKGEEHVQALLTEFAAQGGGIVVADAVTQQDMALLEAACYAVNPSILLVGSAGLAQPRAARLQQQKPTPKPVLTIVGSVNPVSREQLKRLQREGAGFLLVTAADLLAEESAWQDILLHKQAELRSMLLQYSNVAVATPGNREEVQAMVHQGEAMGITVQELAHRIAARTTHVAKTVLQEGPKPTVAGVVVTGGDMAQAMLFHLGVTGIDLLDEVSPGIPVGLLCGTSVSGLRVVTKAGGFGTAEALLEAASFLRERS